MERYVIPSRVHHLVFVFYQHFSVYHVRKSSSECDRNLRPKIPRSLFLKALLQQGKSRNQPIANLNLFPNLLKLMCSLVLLMSPVLLVKMFSRTVKHPKNLINELWIFLPMPRMLLCHLLLFQAKLHPPKNSEKQQADNCTFRKT